MADWDPNKIMHVPLPVRLGISAWADDVTPTTIAKCWLKAHVLGAEYRPLSEAETQGQEKKD